MKLQRFLHISLTVLLLLIFSGAGQCSAKSESFQCRYCPVDRASDSRAESHSSHSHLPENQAKKEQSRCDHSLFSHSDCARYDSHSAAKQAPKFPLLHHLLTAQYTLPEDVDIPVAAQFSRQPPPYLRLTRLFTRNCSLLI